MRRGGFFGLLLLLAGCAHQAAPPQDVSNPRLHLALTTTPRPPTSLDPTAFTVRLTDTAGQPVSGAAAAVWLVMPAMNMGENKVALREQAAGTYAGTGRFTMAGAWRATVSVSEGADSAAQAFPLQVR